MVPVAARPRLRWRARRAGRRPDRSPCTEPRCSTVTASPSSPTGSRCRACRGRTGPLRGQLDQEKIAAAGLVRQHGPAAAEPGQPAGVERDRFQSGVPDGDPCRGLDGPTLPPGRGIERQHRVRVPAIRRQKGPTPATETFWKDLASVSGHDPQVIFDLFNEPRTSSEAALRRPGSCGSMAAGSRACPTPSAWRPWRATCGTPSAHRTCSGSRVPGGKLVLVRRDGEPARPS